MVVKHMMHGPCGVLNPKNVCMQDGAGKNYYPRPFNAATLQGKDSYPVYKRRDDSRRAKVRGRLLDNRWVVPYNPYLLRKYNCHINVEVCSSINAVKYLFKYIYKGHDRASVSLDELDSNGRPSQMSVSTSLIRCSLTDSCTLRCLEPPPEATSRSSPSQIRRRISSASLGRLMGPSRKHRLQRSSNSIDEVWSGFVVLFRSSTHWSEYDTIGTSVKATVVYLGTTLVKLVCLATLLKVPENDSFDSYQELMKILIGFIDVAGLYFALTQLTHRNISQNHKLQVVGLGNYLVVLIHFLI